MSTIYDEGKDIDSDETMDEHSEEEEILAEDSDIEQEED